MTTSLFAATTPTTQISSETAVVTCRVLDPQGTFLASGTALVEHAGDRTEAMVQARQPAGMLVLAIFSRGERRFLLELPGEAALPVELTGSAWLADGGRICRFRAA
jgi:hypothetical protein